MTLWHITMAVAAFNLMTYGNGPVMVPLLHEYLVNSTRVPGGTTTSFGLAPTVVMVM